MANVSFAGGDERELLKNEALVGVDPSFQYGKYYYRGEDQGPHTTVSNTENLHIVTENQLHKNFIPFKKNILTVFDHFAGGKPACVWLSETLPWDIGLPMTTRPPTDPPILQAFILCEGRPPVLLSLCGQGKDVDSVKDYTKETARLTHWSLLDYCHLNFSVLPCSMKLDDFEHEQSLENTGEILQRNVQDVKAAVEFNMERSLALDGEMLCQLRAATRALTGATFLRSYLMQSKGKSVFLMGKKQRDAVSLAIEEFHETGQYQATYPSDKAVSDEAIVALEVAKRISFTERVHVACPTEQVNSCLQHIKQHTEDQVDIPLQLIIGKGQLKCDGKHLHTVTNVYTTTFCM
ncbi:uncharacterized protein [Littorina saxatilis]|uniref:uncharacterized protein n=1 Tax=Littorina saxatilis TaxID=31220 RepID=UPI0038B623E2